MSIFYLFLAVVFVLFTAVVMFGAPYLPTLGSRVEDAINLLNLRPGQTMLELGSGDGRLLIAAAKKGIYSVGYEMNPLLCIYSQVRSYRYKKFIKIVWGNYWTKPWPKADGMYVFLLKPYMGKLDKKVIQYLGGDKLKVVSFAFKIEGRTPTKEINGMFLYEYS